MSVSDIVMVVMALVMGIVVPTVAFLIVTLQTTKEKVLVLESRHKGTEGEVHELKNEIAEVKKTNLTIECVREVVEGALDRQAAREESRKSETARTMKLEIKAAVGEELEKTLPSIVRSVMRESDEEDRDRERRRKPT